MKKIAIISGGNIVDSMSWHVRYTLNKMGYISDMFYLDQNHLEALVPASIISILRRGFKSFEEYQYKKLIENIVAYEPELIIVIIRNIPPRVIDELKKQLKTKIIFWTGDSLLNLERGYVFLSDYDAWFVKDMFMYDFMKNKSGLNVHYVPECCNPDFHYLEKEVEFGSLHNVTIAGTLYPYRASIISQLEQKNIQVDIFGYIPRWMDEKWHKQHTHQYIKLENKRKVFRGSKINLNTLHYSEIKGANCRLFELAGCGGFQLCDKREIIKSYFNEDEEIVLYTNTNELIDKINYFKNNTEQAKQIANKASKRAHLEHTYEKRILQIFKYINFDQVE